MWQRSPKVQVYWVNYLNNRAELGIVHMPLMVIMGVLKSILSPSFCGENYNKITHMVNMVILNFIGQEKKSIQL